MNNATVYDIKPYIQTQFHFTNQSIKYKSKDVHKYFQSTHAKALLISVEEER